MKRERAPVRGRAPKLRKVRVLEAVITYDPSERTPYKYFVEIPAIPNCFSEARTRDEAIENIKEVVALMLPVRERDVRIRKETAVLEVPA